MNKEQTLRRKNERKIKELLKKACLNIEDIKHEIYINNNFKQQINLTELNQSFTEPKKKKIDLRLLRYPW